MKIYIPTFRRVDNQITFNNLPDAVKENVILVIQEQEKDQYKYDCEYLVVGNNIGIAKTRENIYRHAGKNRFGMLDDDVRFYRRNTMYYKGEESNMEKSRRMMNQDDWKDWFDVLNELLDNEDMMHIGNRDNSLPPKLIRFYYHQLIIATHWIDGSKLNKFIDEVDWNLVQVGEDNVLSLECAMRGYKNAISDEFLMTRWETAFAKGGCSDFRTVEVNAQEHMKLVKKYPIVTMTNEFYEWKRIGRMRRFNVDIKGAYNSHNLSTLDKFMT